MKKEDLKHGQIVSRELYDENGHIWCVEEDKDGDFFIRPIIDGQVHRRNSYGINYDEPIAIGYIGKFKLVQAAE